MYTHGPDFLESHGLSIGQSYPGSGYWYVGVYVARGPGASYTIKATYV